MKKNIILIFSILLFSSGVIYGEIQSKGIGLLAKVDIDTSDDSYTETEEIELYFRPYMAMMLNDKTEIDIFFSISKEVEKTDGETTSDYTTFGLGTALYIHAVKGKFVDLSTGLDLGIYYSTYPEFFSYTRFGARLGMPIILDVKFSDKFFFRIKHSIASLSFYSTKYTVSSSSNEETSTSFYFDSYHKSTPSVELGFLFWF